MVFVNKLKQRRFPKLVVFLHVQLYVQISYIQIVLQSNKLVHVCRVHVHTCIVHVHVHVYEDRFLFAGSSKLVHVYAQV